MSNTSQGPGWWLASDGKWYPPELWTGPPASGPPASGPVTSGSPAVDAPLPQAQPGYPNAGQRPATTPPQFPGTWGRSPANGQSQAPPTGYAPSAQDPPYGQSTPYGESTPYGQTPQYSQYGQYNQYGQFQQYRPEDRRKTNGLAIAALVCGLGGFLLYIPAVLGIIFGFVSRTQIKRSNGAQKGAGMALAGIIAGFAWIAVLVLVTVVNHTTNNALIDPGLLVRQLGLSVICN